MYKSILCISNAPISLTPGGEITLNFYTSLVSVDLVALGPFLVRINSSLLKSAKYALAYYYANSDFGWTLAPEKVPTLLKGGGAFN